MGVDLSDAEFARPGELDAPAPVEAWPERTDRRVLSLERRLRNVEGTALQMGNEILKLQATVAQLLLLLEVRVDGTAP